MAHRYGEVIRVDMEPTQPGAGILHRFIWRGRAYPVTAILSQWHLRDRWWDQERHSDRRYFRVETPDHGVYELYLDTVSGVWVLDVVQD